MISQRKSDPVITPGPDLVTKKNSIKKNRNLRFLTAGIVLFLFSLHELSSQEILRPASVPAADSIRMSSLSFYRILNTYIWNGDLQKRWMDQNWSFEFHQHIRSRVVKTHQVAIQDEYQGTVVIQRRLSEEWNLLFKNGSSILADNRVIDLGRMAQHQVTAGVEYMPSARITGGLSGGYELNSQEEEADKGFTYGMGFQAQNIAFDEFNASISSVWNHSFLGRRTPKSGDFTFTLLREFSEQVNDSLSIRYGMQRREYYTGLSTSLQAALGEQHNVLQRDASALEIVNQTKYEVGRELSFQASVGLSNRRIDRGYHFRDELNPSSFVGSHIQELQFFGALSLQWLPLSWLNTDIRVSYSERDERHSVDDAAIKSIEEQRAQAKKLENVAQRTMVTGIVRAGVTPSDSVRFTSSVGILRYDTPDISNTDDRDEFLAMFGGEYIHRFSRSLALTLNADLTLFHLVYLRSEQSANNNWNRVLRLAPSVEYVPAPWFRTIIKAEVLANYTVYDYEEQVASIRSFSFRQALWSDSTAFRISDNIEFTILASLRMYERGILKWKEFRERPEEYYVEKAVWPEFIWSPKKELKAGIGFRYFGQDRYRYEKNNRVFSQGIEASGPTVFVEWFLSAAERILLSGWREVQKDNGITKSTISNFSLQVGFTI